MTELSSNLRSKVNLLLNLLHNSPQKLVPMFKSEFDLYRELTLVQPDRVIKDQQGNPAIYFIHRQNTIDLLKRTYGFLSKVEAQKELQDAHSDMG